MEKELYQITKLSFFGDTLVFESEDKKEVATKLVELGAYKQPIMMDAGYMLFFKNNIIKINNFVEKILESSEINEILNNDKNIFVSEMTIDCNNSKLQEILKPCIYLEPKYDGKTSTFNPFSSLKTEEIEELIKYCLK